MENGEDATLSLRQIARWMAGKVASARPVSQRVAAIQWGYRFDVLVGPPMPDAELRTVVVGTIMRVPREQATTGHLDEGQRPVPHHRKAATSAVSVLDRVEQRRQQVHDAVSTGATAAASLDDWEETALRHARATRYRPAGELLAELDTDFADLQRELSRHQTSSALRRLTRVTAQMAGLMFLTLIELNQRAAARSWARTARVAADEAGDPTVTSWVRAQEAYVHYYSGHLVEALDVARHAQALAGRTACVGVPLAAALEARALAALGHGHEAREALERAEAGVALLAPDWRVPSAFGYNEAQLRFHEGNAYTHLHDTRAAWVAQERALALYPHSDYLDRTLVQLDRASCLAHDGDVSTAAAQATRTIIELTDQQRTGMIVARGQQIFDSLNPKQQALPAAREFRDALMLTAAEERNEPSAVRDAR